MFGAQINGGWAQVPSTAIASENAPLTDGTLGTQAQYLRFQISCKLKTGGTVFGCLLSTTA